MVNITPKLEIRFSSHREFHLYYLTKHTNLWCKRLHLIGSVIAVLGCILGAVRLDPLAAVGGVVAGVLTAWAGDYCFQKQTPTTFKYPLWSIRSHCTIVMAMLKGDLKI